MLENVLFENLNVLLKFSMDESRSVRSAAFKRSNLRFFAEICEATQLTIVSIDRNATSLISMSANSTLAKFVPHDNFSF